MPDGCFLLRERGVNSASEDVSCAFELRRDRKRGGETFMPTSACPSGVPTACLSVFPSLLHLFLCPQSIEFSIRDHGGSSGKLCTVLGHLLAGFKVIYVFEHLQSEKYWRTIKDANQLNSWPWFLLYWELTLNLIWSIFLIIISLGAINVRLKGPDYAPCWGILF